jgi:YlmC/YmxH family sporulation protein
MEIQLTFCELRKKDVINLIDGRRLGRIIDVIFNIKGHIEGFIVPGIRKWTFFKACDNIFIKWCDIKKIGEDVILVELRPQSFSSRPQGCHDKDKDKDRDDCCCQEDICVDFMPNDIDGYRSSSQDSNAYYMNGQNKSSPPKNGAYYNQSPTHDQNINYFMKYYQNKD